MTTEEIIEQLKIVAEYLDRQVPAIGGAGMREAINLIQGQQISNDPLTLEELRGMGGKPYFHVGLRPESKPPHWAILDPFFAKNIQDYKYGENWMAYRKEI